MDEKKPNEEASSLRTYRGDVEEMLKSGDGSLTKIALAENEKRIRAEGFLMDQTGNPTPDQTRVIIIASVVLVLLGLTTLGVIYFVRNSRATTQQTITTARAPLIATDFLKTVDISGLTRDQIIKTLIKERDGNKSALASVTGIQLTEGSGENAKTITAKDFLEKLKTRVPSELARSLDDNFLFGIQASNAPEPVLILKTSYYQNAFAGMLLWEKDLREDLGPLFIRPEPELTASSSDDVLNQTQVFQDIVVKNRDTRALHDTYGKIIFLYSFPDKSSIIITTNANTLQEVATRLFAGKLVQ